MWKTENNVEKMSLKFSFLYMKDKGKIGNTKISLNCSLGKFWLRVFFKSHSWRSTTWGAFIRRASKLMKPFSYFTQTAPKVAFGSQKSFLASEKLSQTAPKSTKLNILAYYKKTVLIMEFS